jgi:hypothetical protein
MTSDRRNLLLLVGFWLATGAVMTLLSWRPIGERLFPDPDDFMRLLQVRDWVGGQGWFDVTQYRLNPPAGVPMHWSRLVDVPLAAVILLARPFLGPQGAETAAMIAVPLLTLGIVMLLVNAIALRLVSPSAALIAAVATPFTLGALKQMRPMRVDHHGWQIVAALAAILAALDDRPRRSGIVAGIAMALWMNISIEGLPFAAAIGALFAWRWLNDAAESVRLRSYLASLALSSALAFVGTHSPSTWLGQPRDVVTPAHLAAFTAAALVAAVAVRRTIAQWGSRFAMLALVGVAAAAAIFAVDPHWLKGPFGSLPPLVKAMWYDRVDEGLPIWQVKWSEGAMALAQPLVGLAGAILAIRGAAGEQRERWVSYLVLLLAAALASAYVLRTGTTASIIALPATAFLCQQAWIRARRVSLMPVRIVATAGAICVMTPAFAVPLGIAPLDNRLEHAVKAANYCSAKREMEKLQWLSPADIAAPLDITPALIFDTSHRALASGHHRNAAAMDDVIRLFLHSPDQGERILARRQVDYVVICPDAPESIRYSYRGPNGLMAMLRAGKAPAWLEPVAIPGMRWLKVWRVRKDRIASSTPA